MNNAEFDRFADEYDQLHSANIALSGEKPEFFHEYKIKFVAKIAAASSISPSSILDFGSGIGNSVPFFRKYFPEVRLLGVDVSPRSLEVANSRFPGQAQPVVLESDRIPLNDSCVDLCFSACVFHHISHTEHQQWLRELLRVTRPGGMFVLFEHNPRNPITVRAVNTCPFDENAHLVRPNAFSTTFRETGWMDVRLAYHLFFPRPLAALRVLEPYLAGVPYGGQYSICARKAPSI